MAQNCLFSGCLRRNVSAHCLRNGYWQTKKFYKLRRVSHIPDNLANFRPQTAYISCMTRRGGHHIATAPRCRRSSIFHSQMQSSVTAITVAGGYRPLLLIAIYLTLSTVRHKLQQADLRGPFDTRLRLVNGTADWQQTGILDDSLTVTSEWRCWAVSLCEEASKRCPTVQSVSGGARCSSSPHTAERDDRFVRSAGVSSLHN